MNRTPERQYIAYAFQLGGRVKYRWGLQGDRYALRLFRRWRRRFPERPNRFGVSVGLARIRAVDLGVVPADVDWAYLHMETAFPERTVMHRPFIHH